MIIFYDKKTREIFSVIEGRHHDKPEEAFVSVTGKEKEDIGKYIVPFKIVYKMVEEPVIKYRLINPKTKEVEPYQDGVKMVKAYGGTEPDVPFASLIISFEKAEEDIYKYKIVLSKVGKVTGFEKLVCL